MEFYTQTVSEMYREIFISVKKHFYSVKNINFNAIPILPLFPPYYYSMLLAYEVPALGQCVAASILVQVRPIHW